MKHYEIAVAGGDLPVGHRQALSGCTSRATEHDPAGPNRGSGGAILGTERVEALLPGSPRVFQGSNSAQGSRRSRHAGAALEMEEVRRIECAEMSGPW